MIELLGIDVLLFALIGLLAGAHCIGMCGPLVTVYSERLHAGGPARDHRSNELTMRDVRQHALFNIGRAISYTALGAVFGGLGGLLFLSVGELAAVVDPVRGVVGIAIGTAIIAIGGFYIGGRTHLGGSLPGTTWLVRRITGYVDRLVHGPGIVGLGAIHGILPCPVLYPAYLFAFATGSVVAGAVSLGALGVGTIPAVFLYGTVIDSVSVTKRRRIHRLLGVAFVVLGYVLLAHGLMNVGIHVPHPELPFWDAVGEPSGHEHH